MCQERTLFPTSTQAKWERKIQVKLNPFFLRESDLFLFFFYFFKSLEGSGQKNLKIKQKSGKKSAQTPPFRQNNICVFAFKLLLKTK